MYYLVEFCKRLHDLTRKEATELIEEEINFLEVAAKGLGAEAALICAGIRLRFHV